MTTCGMIQTSRDDQSQRQCGKPSLYVAKHDSAHHVCPECFAELDEELRDDFERLHAPIEKRHRAWAWRSAAFGLEPTGSHTPENVKTWVETGETDSNRVQGLVRLAQDFADAEAFAKKDQAAVSRDAAAVEIPRAIVDGALRNAPPHGATGEALTDRPLRFFVQGFETEYASRDNRALWFVSLTFEGDISHRGQKPYRMSVPPDIGERLHTAYEAGHILELREVLPSPPIAGVDRAVLREKAYAAASSARSEREWAFAVRSLAAVASPRAVAALLDELERLERIVAGTALADAAPDATSHVCESCALGGDHSEKLCEFREDTGIPTGSAWLCTECYSAWKSQPEPPIS